MHHLFLDFNAAYDRINRSNILLAMSNLIILFKTGPSGKYDNERTTLQS